MRRPFLWRAVAAALTVGIACSCSKPNEGAIRVAVIGADLEITDPSQGPLTAPQEILLANVAQGLVRFDARGQIEPGLAERWNVSDDGLSYIFRIAATQWPDGRRVTAHQVARILKRQIAPASRNPLKDPLGAIDDIVAMTDRVIEIRLRAPRPNLLQILAQPQMSLAREGMGTGPFRIEERDGGALRLERMVVVPDSEEDRREDLLLSATSTSAGIEAFRDKRLDLLLGGTFAELPLATSVELPRNALRFDPVAGLFGFIPARGDGPLANPEVRRLLSQAIDREALIAELRVPGLFPRATVLEAGLEGVADPVPPPWLATALADRRPALAVAGSRLFANDQPTLRIAVPDGPGADLLIKRIQIDWSPFGIRVEKAASARAADLVLIDEVAPSLSPAWYLRHFRCGSARICDPAIDELLDSARASSIPAQRAALLAEAARLIDEAQLYIPIAAPVRWSLVSPRVVGFAGNRTGRHTLTALEDRLERERAE